MSHLLRLLTVVGGSASVRGAAGTDIGAARPACPIDLPQPPQNLAADSFSKPQAGHCEGSGDPHSAQKRRVPAFSARQLGQRIQSLGLATRLAVRIPRGHSRQKRRFNARRDQSRPPRKAENPGPLRRTELTPPKSAPKPPETLESFTPRYEISYRRLKLRSAIRAGQLRCAVRDPSRVGNLAAPGLEADMALQFRRGK